LTHPLEALRRCCTLNVVLQLVGAALGLGGQLLVNRHDPGGFVLWMASNVALVWLQLRLRLFVLVALSSVYLLFCLEGWWRWTR
jgi:hypothetical protein